MIAFALLFAAEAPPPTELVGVRGSADGGFAAVETRWVLDGPGFPAARIDVLDLRSGAVVQRAEFVSDPSNASGGLDGALAAVRLRIAPTLERLRIERPLAATACISGGCGAAGGCGGGVALPVLVSGANVAGETCPQGWEGTTPSVTMAGHPVTTPIERPDCARAWEPVTAYRAAQGVVLVLGYEVPGHEGPAHRFVAVAGPAQ